MTLVHNGTDSLITDSGTGSLALGGSAVFIQNAAHSANMASFVAGAEANLFHNGSQRLKTTSDGIQVEGPEGSAASNQLYSDQGDDNADKWRIYNTGGNFLKWQTYQSGAWQDAISAQGENQVRLFYNGSEKLNTGNHGISISGKIYMNNGNLQFASSSNGIDFSTGATGGASSSLLDDYEEGTFTPRLGGTSNNGTYYVEGTGTYIKIGRKVTVSIRFNAVDLNDTASGNATVFNLPFTAGLAPTNGVAGVTSNVQYYKVPFSTTYLSSWYVGSGSTSWNGLVSRSNNTWDNFPASDFHATGLYMNFTGTYFTA